MERHAALPESGRPIEPAHGAADAATIADLTLRREYPRPRVRPADGSVYLPWLRRYQALKDAVERDGDEDGRELLLHVRRLIARSRFADVEFLLSLEEDAVPGAARASRIVNA